VEHDTLVSPFRWPCWSVARHLAVLGLFLDNLRPRVGSAGPGVWRQKKWNPDRCNCQSTFWAGSRWLCAKAIEEAAISRLPAIVLTALTSNGGLSAPGLSATGCRRCQQGEYRSLVVFSRPAVATALTLSCAGGHLEMKITEKAGTGAPSAGYFPKRIGTVNSRSDQKRITDSGTGSDRSATSLNIRGFCCPKEAAARVGQRARRHRQRTVAIHKECLNPGPWQPARKTGQQTVRQAGGQSFLPIKKPQQ